MRFIQHNIRFGYNDTPQKTTHTATITAIKQANISKIQYKHKSTSNF